MASMKAIDMAKERPATVAEACEYLRIKKTKLYELLNARQIPYGRSGRKRLIPWPALREFYAKSLDRINNL